MLRTIRPSMIIAVKFIRNDFNVTIVTRFNWGSMEGTARFIVLMTILSFAKMQEEIAEGACSCAVFAVPGTEPIIEQTLQYNVSCDQRGTERCQQLCIVLAKSNRDRAPMLICEKLNMHVENLKVAVYMNLCNAALWTFTGLESTEVICCHEGKTVICNQLTSVIEN